MTKFIPSFNLKFFSSYYISLLISSFLLQLDFLGSVVVGVTSWLNSVLIYTAFKDIFAGDKSWFIVFFGFSIFVALVQHFVVIPLDFYTHKDIKMSNIGKPALILIIFGFQVYLTNKIFANPMPSSVFDRNIINFFGGLDNLNISQSYLEKQLWSPRYLFWHIAPLLVLYYNGVLYKSNTTSQGGTE